MSKAMNDDIEKACEKWLRQHVEAWNSLQYTSLTAFVREQVERAVERALINTDVTASPQFKQLLMQHDFKADRIAALEAELTDAKLPIETWTATHYAATHKIVALEAACAEADKLEHLTLGGRYHWQAYRAARAKTRTP